MYPPAPCMLGKRGRGSVTLQLYAKLCSRSHEPVSTRIAAVRSSLRFSGACALCRWWLWPNSCHDLSAHSPRAVRPGPSRSALFSRHLPQQAQGCKRMVRDGESEHAKEARPSYSSSGTAPRSLAPHCDRVVYIYIADSEGGGERWGSAECAHGVHVPSGKIVLFDPVVELSSVPRDWRYTSECIDSSRRSGRLVPLLPLQACVRAHASEVGCHAPNYVSAWNPEWNNQFTGWQWMYGSGCMAARWFLL
jgi:hypothetical protein